ncbi:MAG TPA: HAD-IC family P-type ATPase [Thermodesulfobacteriota bacterium]|nr:HAD-IC family P-type ATPase [Thermodesulfobacteriota bacterium]
MMKISDLLDESTVELNLKVKRKEEAVRELVNILYKAKKIKNPEEIIATLLEREESTHNILENGVAIPHATVEGLQGVVAGLVISKPGIDFGTTDKRYTRIIFLFLSPAEETETHLQILSKAEGLLQNKRLCDSLLSADSKKKLIGEIINAERLGWDAYMNLSKEEIHQELGTTEKGLSEGEAKRKLQKYGPNVLERVQGKPLALRFLNNLTNLFAVLLWIGGVLAFIADMPQLGWAIIAVIWINAAFSFWQEYKAEKAVEALRELIPSYSSVLRDGQEKRILTSEIVPGDVILLKEGDKVPADGRLFEAFDMRVDNSALTGESRPIYKIAEPVLDGKSFLWTEIPNLIFGGTGIISGDGKAMVIATGMHSEIGKIARLTQAIKEEPSPLQKEMVKVTKVVSVLAVSMGVLFFFLGSYVAQLTTFESFIFAIGIIVANVPEGLLPTVSLALAMAVQRMAKRHVIVKRLSSVETLGCTTVICTDKTGTLTTNQVSVVKLWFNNKIFEITGSDYNPIGEILYDGSPLSTEWVKNSGIEKVIKIGALCNNAEVLAPAKGKPFWSTLGDPTEGALLVFAQKAGFNYREIKNENPRIFQHPFDSVRKRMSTINDVGENNTLANVKGAPREVLSLCNSVYLDGRKQPLTDEVRNDILMHLDKFAREGLRVLGLAFRELERKDFYQVREVENELTFAGLTGMMDPPRPEVPEAVRSCHSAGIRAVMITGDYGLTALSIARKIDLVRGENVRVITGAELGEMKDNELKESLETEEVIFARTSPEHKMRIVKALKDMGEIVAVTGDGVNDAPALKEAHVGIAMGLRGTEVAKEAATIILTDDNFASIVAGIEEGRAIYSNIKKFVTYILASNVPEIIPFILFVLFKIPLPLTIMQILAVDLGTDLIPALGLGVERPEPGLMKQPPRSLTKRLLDLPLLLRAYGFLGIIEASACMAAYFFVYYSSGWRPGLELASSGHIYLQATTMCLAGIIATQIGNVFACRTERESVFKIGFFSNRLILLGILAELVLINLIIYLSPFQKVFNTFPLTLLDWTFLFVFAPTIFLAEEGRKYLLRLTKKSA